MKLTKLQKLMAPQVIHSFFYWNMKFAVAVSVIYIRAESSKKKVAGWLKSGHFF